MYHQPASFGSHEALLMASQEEKLNFHSLDHEDHTIHSQVPSCASELFDHHQKFLFDPTIIDPRLDLGHLPMQGGNYHHQCVDPTTYSHSSALQMRALGNLYSLPDFLSGELPADSGSVASTILNDPSMRDLVYSLPQDHCGFLPGGGLDEVFGEQFENPESKTCRQGGVSRREKENGSLKTEKQRRERSSMKYTVLKSLIPNQTKPDRATILSDAMDYINELLRTVKELKMLVEKKRRRRQKSNKLLMMDEVDGDTESTSMKLSTDDPDCDLKLPLRSSWLQRKSKETFVDVRIIEDEVYIKLTQRKMVNCLLVLSKALDDLQLQLLHLSGGNIGDCHIFSVNAKIHEGSSVYASAIAKKLIEAMDLHHQKLANNF